MNRLLTPRWIAAHVVVLVIAVVFVNLGLWQLRRLEQRQLENAIAESRYTAPPEKLETLLETAGADFNSLRYRRAVVQGVYLVEEEVLMRNQVYLDQAGFHVIDPLAFSDGRAVLVNRGWVPLELDDPPVQEALPPTGDVQLTGWINTTQTRPSLGPADPESGDLEIMNRVDIARIQLQVDEELVPVYLVLEESAGQLPIAVAAPVFDDEGNHLAYAIQWFGFTLIGLIGYVFLIRKSLPATA